MTNVYANDYKLGIQQHVPDALEEFQSGLLESVYRVMTDEDEMMEVVEVITEYVLSVKDTLLTKIN